MRYFFRQKLNSGGKNVFFSKLRDYSIYSSWRVWTILPRWICIYAYIQKKRWILYVCNCCLTDLAVLIKHTRVPLSCDTIWSIHPRCWTQGLSTSSSAYTIYSSCSTTTPTHSCSAGYFETDWWRPRKGGSAPNYLCMFCLLFYYPSKIIVVVQQYRGRDTLEFRVYISSEENVEFSSFFWGALRFFKHCSRRFLCCDFSFFFLNLKATRSHENLSYLWTSDLIF